MHLCASHRAVKAAPRADGADRVQLTRTWRWVAELHALHASAATTCVSYTQNVQIPVDARSGHAVMDPTERAAVPSSMCAVCDTGLDVRPLRAHAGQRARPHAAHLGVQPPQPLAPAGAPAKCCEVAYPTLAEWTHLLKWDWGLTQHTMLKSRQQNITAGCGPYHLAHVCVSPVS